MNSIKNTLAKLTLLLLSLFSSITLLAQEGGESGGGADINVDINRDGGGTWYTQPWIWIVGAAVFILLLVALLRGGNARRD